MGGTHNAAPGAPSGLLARLESDDRFRRVCSRLAEGRPASAGGLWGSSVSIFLAVLSRHATAPLLVAVPSIEDAERVADDLRLFTDAEVALFPAWEALAAEDAVPSPLHAQRVGLSRRLSAAATQAPPALIVAPVQALLQPVAGADAVAAATLELRVGGRARIEALAEWLVERGLTRATMVEQPGGFSIRGGILDVHPHAAATPVRIEFFGDEIESIRSFDIETQRSSERLESCEILAFGGPALIQGATAAAGSFTRLLPQETWVCLHEPLDIQARAAQAIDQLGPPAGLIGYDDAFAAWSRFPMLHTYALPAAVGEGAVTFDMHAIHGFDGKLESVTVELERLASGNDRVCIFCSSVGERQRLEELLAEAQFALAGRLEYREGHLSVGFEAHEHRFACVGHHEVFSRYAQRQRPRRAKAAPVESFLELKQGDLVVHIAHGIGRFLGMEGLKRRGELEDFLTLEFADHVRLYVPATKIQLVQKYIGAVRGRPTLSKIGGTRWAARKEAAKEAVRDLAQDLLRVQAVREHSPGIAYPVDDALAAEFEHAFLYQETPDQLVANDEIKADMAKPRPMDRLLCGDVGYGKTELAMRAAFRAVAAGRQMAVLVPTTILAQQHFRTFTERFADYPVLVESLSRFKTPAEQREILQRAAEGTVDILIGTHRILSADVSFRDLGLVVIDEEQRFGVDHKERLKHFRATIDVLTMTATPIPRTLHMSMLGIRDISTLDTPPQDRLAIRTQVCRPTPTLIRDAILRELARDGQIFFVHNRVYNIDEVARGLAKLVPEARIVVGHGQMNEHLLEERMTEFVEGRADILVSTTIIESGLDIPRANTLFINRADMFGLAELHQLRGRVGRYKHRAHAYFLLPPDRPLTKTALQRLKAIEDFDELGAGFRIAMRDLEIRGAGNILGSEQSGHLANVGYALYCKLLEQTVKELRNEPVVEKVDVDVDIGLDAYLPTDYVPDDRQRMDIYRTFARAEDPGQLAAVGDEMTDRFGEMPDPVRRLISRHEVRICLEHHGITAIGRRPGYLLLTFYDRDKLRARFAAAGRSLRIIDGHTAHLVHPRHLTDPLQIVEHLRGLFAE